MNEGKKQTNKMVFRATGFASFLVPKMNSGPFLPSSPPGYWRSPLPLLPTPPPPEGGMSRCPLPVQLPPFPILTQQLSVSPHLGH